MLQTLIQNLKTIKSNTSAPTTAGEESRKKMLKSNRPNGEGIIPPAPKETKWKTFFALFANACRALKGRLAQSTHCANVAMQKSSIWRKRPVAKKGLWKLCYSAKSIKENSPPPPAAPPPSTLANAVDEKSQEFCTSIRTSDGACIVGKGSTVVQLKCKPISDLGWTGHQQMENVSSDELNWAERKQFILEIDTHNWHNLPVANQCI